MVRSTTYTIGKCAAALVAFFLINGFTTKRVEFMNVPVGTDHDGKLIEISGLLAKPEGDGSFPAIVILHACGGPNKSNTESWPKFLTGIGYATLSTDSLGPRDLRSCARPRPPMFVPKKIPELWRDFYGSLEYLAKQPFVDKNRIGAIGQSLGGITIRSLAYNKLRAPSGAEFAAGIVLYTRCGVPVGDGNTPYPGEPRFPWLAVIGTNEQPAIIKGGQTALAKAKGVRLHLIAGAYHAFDDHGHQRLREDPFGNSMHYSRKATAEAETVVKEYIAEHMGK